MSEVKKYSAEWFQKNAREARIEAEIREASRREKRIKRTNRGDPEHQLQKSCVMWFDLQFPKYKFDLFAVPNGGHRNKATAGKLKAEGVRAGVSDLILERDGFFGPIVYLELKTDKGRQSDSQKDFQNHVEEKGRVYKVIRSIEDFIEVVTKHLSDT